MICSLQHTKSLGTCAPFARRRCHLLRIDAAPRATTCRPACEHGRISTVCGHSPPVQREAVSLFMKCVLDLVLFENLEEDSLRHVLKHRIGRCTNQTEPPGVSYRQPKCLLHQSHALSRPDRAGESLEPAPTAPQCWLNYPTGSSLPGSAVPGSAVPGSAVSTAPSKASSVPSSNHSSQVPTCDPIGRGAFFLNAMLRLSSPFPPRAR